MILAFDTSTQRMSLAVGRVGDIRARREFEGGRRHAELLVPEIDRLLSGCGLRSRDLTGVAVGLGPGSFTGIRTSLAAAMGLGQSLSIPVAGVSSFAVIAADSPESPVVVVEDAKQEMLYAAIYQVQAGVPESLLTETLLAPPELDNHWPDTPATLAGPAAALVHPLLAASKPDLRLLSEEHHFPRAATLLRLAEPILAQGGTPWEQLAPIYLRRTQAEVLAERKAATK